MADQHDDLPTGVPADEAPTGVPADEAPTGVPADEAPTGVPADEAPTGVPADEAPGADDPFDAPGTPAEQPPEEPAAQPAAPAQPPSPGGLEHALAEAERARDEYLDHLRRERAAFENYRRRANKERMDALDRGAEGLVAGLLSVLDNFGHVIEAAKGSADEQLAKGVQMVHGELWRALAQAGLEEVPGAGASFDPTVHEAVDQVEAPGDAAAAPEQPVVAAVLRPGYRFKGRLLRPASVTVAQ